MTYPLDHNGPILAQKREYANPQRVPQFPIVPVAMTDDGLALGGTTMGEVPIVSTDTQGEERSLIRHGECS